jgi:hypothetical protein
MLLPILACLMMCGQKVVVTVDATSAPSPSGAPGHPRFLVLPGNHAVKPSDPQFRRYADEVGRALVFRGFQPVQDAAAADIIFEVDWEVSDPRTVTRRMSSNQYQQNGTAAGGVKPGTPGMPLAGGGVADMGWSGATVTVKETTYVRTLAVKTFDRPGYGRDPAPKAAWEVTVRSEGLVDDVEPVAPAMAAAAAPYFGQTTGHPVKVSMGDAEDLVKYVRGDTEQPPAVRK